MNVQDLALLWTALDANGDGTLTVGELSNELRASGLTNRAIDKIILTVDANRDGEISFDEFVSAFGNTDASGGPNEEETRGIFNMFDQNGDGDLSCSEIATVLVSMGMTGMNAEETCSLLEAVDTDKSGTISFQEFQVVTNYVQALSEKKFQLYMLKLQVSILEKQNEEGQKALRAQGEKGWALGVGFQAERLTAKIVELEQEMNSLTQGGFGGLMAEFVERKASDENGHTAVAALFEYMPMQDPHLLRESMQKSGRVMDSIPDGFILGKVKQNTLDWGNATLKSELPRITHRLDKELRAVFLYYCDKKCHGLSSKAFLRFARDAKATKQVAASRIQLCFTAATHQQSDRTANCTHDQSHLDFTQWKLAVLALVKCLHEQTCSEKAVNDAVHDVLQRANKMADTDMDKVRIDNKDVEFLMRRYVWTLKFLYDHYSSIKSTTKPGAFCMTINDYAAFLRDFSLMGGASPVCTKNLVSMFKKVKNLASDFEFQLISFSQFIECLGRTALVLFPTRNILSEQLSTVYFQGEAPKSINYVQRYLSRTNHFGNIQYKKVRQARQSARSQPTQKEDSRMLPRMPTRPSRKAKSKRRVRVISRRLRPQIDELPPDEIHLPPAATNHPKAKKRIEQTIPFTSVHISSHEADVSKITLPAIGSSFSGIIQ